MRSSSASAILLLLFVACSKESSRPAPSAPVGKVVEVKGDVTVSRGGGALEKAAVGLDVYRDMTFKTGAEAAVTVRLWNNYTWTLDGDREEKVATISVLDRERIAASPPAGGGEATAAAGRQGEREAGESGSTVAVPAADTAPTPPAPDKAAPPPPPPPPPPAPARRGKRTEPSLGDIGGGGGSLGDILGGSGTIEGGGGGLGSGGGMGGGGAPDIGGLGDIGTGGRGSGSGYGSGGGTTGAGTPDVTALRAALKAAEPEVMACFPAEIARVTARLVLDQTGKVVSVVLVGGEAAAAECARVRIQKIKVEPWSGDNPTSPFSYRFAR